MLVLMRRQGESVWLELPGRMKARVVVVKVDRGQVKVGFDFPKGVRIWREELGEDADPEEKDRARTGGRAPRW